MTFITLFDLAQNEKIRINVQFITTYGVHYDLPCTAVVVNERDINVRETPKQIDTLLREVNVFVKEPHASSTNPPSESI